MNEPTIWLHEEALRVSHPVFYVCPTDTKAIFIWDDELLKKNGYSFKRLLFIYEALCSLPIEIIHGDTFTVLKGMSPETIYTPFSHSDYIKNIVQDLSGVTNVAVIEDEPFVSIPKALDFKRFFQYWNKAERTAFMTDGGKSA